MSRRENKELTKTNLNNIDKTMQKLQYIGSIKDLRPPKWEVSVKGAMSPVAHALASENKLEKDGPSFSSSVGDFGRLFLAV